MKVIYFLLLNSYFTLTIIAQCIETSQCIGGLSFEDFNCNGINNDVEPGVYGVLVNIYDANNLLAGTTTTDEQGNWQVCGLIDAQQYRVEFVLTTTISAWANPTHTGMDNGSDVQFVTAPACANFSLSSPSDFCESNPYILVPCYENGVATGNTRTGLVGLTYEPTHTKTDYTTIEETGAVWGTSWVASEYTFYTAAVLKRHVGFAHGPGYLYVLDF